MTSTPERIFRGLGYMCLGLSAVISAVDPSRHFLHPVIAWIWVCFIATSLPACLATFSGLYRIEFSLIPFFAGAMLIVDLVYWTQAGNGVLSLVRALFISVIVCSLLARWSALFMLMRIKRTV